MPRYTTIKIHSEGGIRVSDVALVLTTLDETYNAICVYDGLLDSARRRGDRPPFYFAAEWFPFLWQARFGHIREWPPKPQALRTFVRPRDRLVLKSVELHSPGFWEVVGSLNPLETIRKWLNDAHERRKDREYRETAERDRMELENRLLETELMSKQIELVKGLGATDSDLATFRNALVIEPLMKLEQLQDRGLIGGAESVETDGDDT